MKSTNRARRKRSRRWRADRSQPDDEGDNPNFPDFVWIPFTVGSLILLLVSALVGMVSASLGDLVRVLYALVCLILFALTTSFVVQEIRQDIRDSPLNVHIYRKQTLRQMVRQVGSYLLFGWLLYVPSVILPMFVFRTAWLACVVVLIALSSLAFGGYTAIRWWRYRTANLE